MTEKQNGGGNNQKLWGYSESFSFAFGIIIAGFLIEFFTSGKTIVPEWPVNIFIIIGYIVLTAVFYYGVKGKTVKWLVSIPSAIAAVSSMAILVLMMGFVPQDDVAGKFSTEIGLTHITRSWPYLLLSLYLLTVLTFSIYKRLTKPVTLKKVAYLLNHGGLWIVVVTASLGTAELKRLSMYVEEGETQQVAIDAAKNQYRVPFEITLHDFVMDEYPPKVAIYSNITGELLKTKKDKNPVLVEGDLNTSIGPWEIEVLEYHPNAIPGDNGFAASEKRGAAPAAFISVRNPEKNISRKEWVTCGSAWVKAQRMPLSRAFTLVMLTPSPKRYASDLTILTPDGNEQDITLEVNKPFSYGSWKIYQSGYDSRLGKYSELSILELVYDPWLDVVYTGIFMLFLGSLYLMLFGKKK